MRRTTLAVAAAAALGLAVLGAPAAQAVAPAERANSEIEAMPIRSKAPTTAAVTANPITFHNGPVMNATTGVNAYVIWYGAWDNGAAAPVSYGSSVIRTMLSSIGGSPYWNTNSTYTGSNGVGVANIVTLKGETTDFGYSLGKRLSDSNVRTIVSNAISSGRLPKDSSGVYFVLTSRDVAESSGFLTKYCGWHTHATLSSTDIKYSFVGDPSSKLSTCAGQTLGPNGSINAGADAMVSVIAHELEEAASDPDLNAWYDGSGYENADKCAWTWGTTSLAPNGAKYNVTWGGMNFLIQRNWVAGAVQACAMAY